MTFTHLAPNYFALWYMFSCLLFSCIWWIAKTVNMRGLVKDVSKLQTDSSKNTSWRAKDGGTRNLLGGKPNSMISCFKLVSWFSKVLTSIIFAGFGVCRGSEFSSKELFIPNSAAYYLMVGSRLVLDGVQLVRRWGVSVVSWPLNPRSQQRSQEGFLFSFLYVPTSFPKKDIDQFGGSINIAVYTWYCFSFLNSKNEKEKLIGYWSTFPWANQQLLARWGGFIPEAEQSVKRSLTDACSGHLLGLGLLRRRFFPFESALLLQLRQLWVWEFK